MEQAARSCLRSGLSRLPRSAEEGPKGQQGRKGHESCALHPGYPPAIRFAEHRNALRCIGLILGGLCALCGHAVDPNSFCSFAPRMQRSRDGRDGRNLNPAPCILHLRRQFVLQNTVTPFPALSSFSVASVRSVATPFFRIRFANGLAAVGATGADGTHGSARPCHPES